MKHAYGLRKQFSLFVLGIAFGILLIYGAAFVVLYRMNDGRARLYVESLTEKTAASLSEFASNLELAGHSFSFNPFLSSLILGQARERSLSDIETLFALTRTVVKFNSATLVDIMAIDLSGKGLSLFAGVDDSAIGAIRAAFDYRDRRDVNRRFVMFPRGSAASAYLAYLVPIFDTAPPFRSAEKIATAVFVISKSGSIDRIVSSVDPGIVRFYLTDPGGAVVASNLRGDLSTVPSRSDAVYRDLPSLGLSLRAFRSFSFDAIGVFLIGYFLFSFFLLLGVFSATVYFVDRVITRPITRLHDEMERIGSDLSTERLSALRNADMDSIARKINGLLDQADASAKMVLETRRRLHESELRKNEAELYALQSQVNPHFLYNTLQCVRGIAIHHGIDDIAYIALALSELFRYSIKGADLVSVSDELAIVRHYLRIMEIRYSGRFSFSVDVEDSLLHLTMPKMALQPLVENAIIHGFEQTDKNGYARIEGRLLGGAALFSVKDNGVGITPERLEEIRCALDSGIPASGRTPFMGLNNIHRRIRLRFGSEWGLSLDSSPGAGTTATLRFPAADHAENGEA